MTPNGRVQLLRRSCQLGSMSAEGVEELTPIRPDRAEARAAIPQAHEESQLGERLFEPIPGAVELAAHLFDDHRIDLALLAQADGEVPVERRVRDAEAPFERLI